MGALLVLGLLLAAGLPQAQGPLQPGRRGLTPVPLPPVADLEDAVVEQLDSARREVEQAAVGRAATRELAGAYGSLAQAYHAYELFDSAEAAYLNAASLAPREGRWPHLLGYLYQQAGRWEDAVRQLTTAERLDPDRRESSARLAEVLLELNRLRDARERFNMLVEVFPAFARQGLGEVALREGRFQDAIDHFRDVLKRIPSALAVHYSLAMAYRGAGRLEAARAELERRGPGRVTLGDPLVDALSTLVRGERLLVVHGVRALDAGDVRAAAGWFDKAVAAAPDSAAARTNLASALLRLGEHEKAIEQFYAVLRLDPGDDAAAVSLAILLAERTQFADAIGVLTRALARSPESIPAATTLARLLAAAPDPGVRDGEKALELATRVYSTDAAPAHAETVALALASLGRCAEAMDWLRRAIAAAGRSSDAAETARLKAEVAKYDACRR